jgi:hypothetical protein
MRAEALTREMGGRWHGRYGTARCPAHRDTNPSLSIKDGDNGRLLLFCHAGCEFSAIVAALKNRGIALSRAMDDFADRAPENWKPQQPIADLIRLIWSQSRPIEGTHAERYLRARGIDAGSFSRLRFHGALRHPTGERLPALVGLVEHVHGPAVGLHRTYVDPRAPRKTTLAPDKAMLGDCKGGAVRLRGGQNGLAVCEGIETSLSLAAGLGEEFAVWAALSRGGVAGLELPARSAFGGCLLIGTDGDAPGRQAGAALADRATVLGWKVEIVAAPEGQDFNDLIGGRCHG